MPATIAAPNILSLKPLVWKLARAVMKRTGAMRTLTLHDLVQWGWLGAMDAARRYDPDRGVSLATFAMPRIRGYIIDELRQFSPLSRLHVQQIQCGTMLPIKWHLLSSLEHDDSGKALELLVAATEDTAWEGEHWAELLRRALDPRQAWVVWLRIWLGRTYPQIGAVLGFSGSRACQLYMDGLRELRDYLSGHPEWLPDGFMGLGEAG